MKKLLILTILLSCINGIDASESNKQATHTNLGVPVHPLTGQPIDCNKHLQNLMKKYGHLIDQNIPKFQQGEYALLFDEIMYHVDVELNLNNFHKNPMGTILGNFQETIGSFHSFLNSSRYHKNDSYEIARENFNLEMNALLRYYAYIFSTLSEKEQTIGNKSDFQVNGIFCKNPALRILGNANKIAESLTRADIPSTQDSVLNDMQKMVENLKKSKCPSTEHLTPFEKRYTDAAQPKTHSCLYASTVADVLKAVRKYSKDVSAIK